MRNKRIIEAIALCLVIVFGLGGLWLAAYIWKGRQPLPGYGRSAYAGPPANARLDVDLMGDPRYGGIEPDVITLEQLKTRATYTVPRTDWLGELSRVDYWPTNGSSRLVFEQGTGELQLTLWPLPDAGSRQIIAQNLNLPAVRGSSRWTLNGVTCQYSFDEPYGYPPAVSMLHPDGSVLLEFKGRHLDACAARELAEQATSALVAEASD